ncbi:MAG TPA: hypothetical protein VLT59_01510 [Steroidobacteraceae bacterium]|nr:hypothetical protein [Steroidobacteraceae bacterium]
MKPTNIVILAVLGAMLVVLIAQLRAPERIEVTQLPPGADTGQPGPSTPTGRFDPAVATLATDSFQQRLVVSELASRWSALGLPPDLPEAVANGRLGGLTVQLDEAAEAGNAQANFVLAELETFCDNVRADRDRDLEPVIRAAQSLPPAETSHVRSAAGWMTWIDEQLYLQCRDAIFDSIAIATRIDAAAAEGHPPSQWRRGLQATDPQRSYRDVLDAALAGFLAAELTLANYFGTASSLLFEGQKVLGSRSFWLQQAAEQSANAQAMLGECFRVGCDAAAPAPARAAEQFVTAARSGVRLAHRGLTELSENHPEVVSRANAYAWRSVSQRLNELGCYGLSYIRYYVEDAREMPVLRARLGTQGQASADQLAEQLWSQYGDQAREYLGCAA